MTNLSGISLICVAGDGVCGAPITIGAPLMAANSANAVALRSLTLKLIASMIGSPSDSPVSLRLRQRRQEKGPTHTSIKTVVMGLLTEMARSACLIADRSTHPPH